MLDAIAARRSIRKFKNTPVPRHIIEEIIKAGALAPSSKNRQPWHFVVTTGKAKEEALAAMEQGLRREAQQPLLPGTGPAPRSAAAAFARKRAVYSRSVEHACHYAAGTRTDFCSQSAGA